MTTGTLGHALLGLLAERDMTGYELTRRFDRSLAHVWSAQHSQIYPELAKLLREGLIEQSGAGARGAKRYAVTADGRAELVRWMREDEAAPGLRSETMLRVFFLWTLPPAEAARYLREEQRRHQAQLARYESYSDELSQNSPDRMARIALAAGLRSERAMAEWAGWAADELDAAASE